MISGGSNLVPNFVSAENVLNNTDWHHIVLCKVANEYGSYLDGTQVAYVSDADMDTFADNLYIGSSKNLGNYFNGYLD